MMQSLRCAFLAFEWVVASSLIPGLAVPASALQSSPRAIPALPMADSTPSAIPAAQLALSVASGSTGTPLRISGNGFPPGEIVAIYIDAAGPYVANPPPGPRADAQGTIQVSITWPGKNYDVSNHVDPTIPGPHTVCGDTAYPGSIQRIPARGCAQFIVVPLSPSPAASPTISSSGFPVGTVFAVFIGVMILAAGILLVTNRSK